MFNLNKLIPVHEPNNAERMFSKVLGVKCGGVAECKPQINVSVFRISSH